MDSSGRIVSRPETINLQSLSRLGFSVKPSFILTLFLLHLCTVSGQQLRDADNPQGKWEVLTGCRLSTNGVSDGDSFMVAHKARDYIFRLYYVDAPETDTALDSRVEDQAAYFNIRPEAKSSTVKVFVPVNCRERARASSRNPEPGADSSAFHTRLDHSIF